MVFRMKILGFSRSEYERQIKESVVIQNNRRHTLLNNKSEFNRCSLPRLTVKLGEREINELAKENEEEMREEEALERVIKEMKIKSKKWRNYEDVGHSGFQHHRKKRRRLDNEVIQSNRKEPERGA